MGPKGLNNYHFRQGFTVITVPVLVVLIPVEGLCVLEAVIV